ncbi:ABC transporter permease [Sinorhizobium meliloti]|uniref:ABC transporter permease n=1 Tax=Rhizobium meliloti TaxID=382 RepID=UPI0001E4CDEA|nr:ABC transporter permease [Sinorhizobium meliloti]AEG58243.1 ABC-type transporter, integral membrane subunit [Sinorhizobium meliloti AK83]MDE4589243.1 ABC transporter permease [Sinorhizobium meliloti]SEJ60576.1 peptide/nickel transport system permease protein [Sinorhizobium meliloti]
MSDTAQNRDWKLQGLLSWSWWHSASFSVKLAFIWIAACVLVAAFAHALAPYDPADIALDARLQPPLLVGGTWDHALGTDDLGRDMLSRLIFSVQISIAIACSGTVISTFIGTFLGFVSAEAGGAIDELIMAVVDMQAALPFMIIAMLMIAIFGSSLALFVVILGLYGWERHARVARGTALAAKNNLYVTAARAYNASYIRIYLKHILPACFPTIMAGVTIGLTEIILLEGTLSFLGLGIQPPMSSLGNMVGFGREYLMTAWWIAVLPGVVIAITALSLMVISDHLREQRQEN